MSLRGAVATWQSIFAILICALLILLSGCAKQPTTIKFASWGSQSEVAIIKPLLAEFEAKNPDVRVDFMHVPQNYFQKIHLLFASNTAPDVIFINNLYLPLYAEFLWPVEVYGDFYPQALEALSWNGELYAVPRDISNLVIYYNKDMFRAKGIPFPRDGWTMREFLSAAQKLTDRPQTFGVSFEEEPLYWWPFVFSDGDFEMPTGDEAGLKFYIDLRKKHHVAPMKNESASATMAQMFLQERLAMHLSGRWMVPKYRAEAKFDWDVATFPRGKAGSIVPADASGWAVAKSSKHPEEARRLVEFLSANDVEFVKSGLIVPARKGVPIDKPAFLNAIKTSRPTPVSKDYIQRMDKLKEELQHEFR